MPTTPGAVGVPIFAAYPFDYGASLRWNSGQFHVTAAVLGGLGNSQDNFDRLGSSFAGRLEWTPSPAWKLGVSYAQGPYLDTSVNALLPPGTRLLDTLQRVQGADLTYAVGPWQVVGEWANSRWDAPTLSRSLGAQSWYVEGKYTRPAGLSARATQPSSTSTCPTTMAGPSCRGTPTSTCGARRRLVSCQERPPQGRSRRPAPRAWRSRRRRKELQHQHETAVLTQGFEIRVLPGHWSTSPPPRLLPLTWWTLPLAQPDKARARIRSRGCPQRA